MASGDTKTEAMLDVLGNGGSSDEFRGCCNTKTQQYILDAIDRVQSVEDEVEELKNNPDVVDIVDTYADLQAYDTQHLTENDIIRVLQDETHSGNSTYYRFTKNPDTWTFIGEISGGSINVVQTAGNSTTDVMSQNATTGLIYYDPDTKSQIRIGTSTSINGNYPISVGFGTYALGNNEIAIGRDAKAGGNTVDYGNIGIGYDAVANGGNRRVAIGYSAKAQSGNNSVALGSYAVAGRAGEVNIGTGTSGAGYNSTNYRVLGGVHDPVDAHDAATKGYVDGLVGNVESALNIINNGTGE